MAVTVFSYILSLKLIIAARCNDNKTQSEYLPVTVKTENFRNANRSLAVALNLVHKLSFIITSLESMSLLKHDQPSHGVSPTVATL